MTLIVCEWCKMQNDMTIFKRKTKMSSANFAKSLWILSIEWNQLCRAPKK